MEAVPSSAVGDLRGRVPARDRSGSQHRARELGPGRQDGVLVDVRHDHRADGMVWGILGLAIHMVGAVSLRLRARREYFVDTPAKWLRDWSRRAREICALEFVPAVAQRDFRMRVFPERQMYLALSWVLSTGIVFHVVFGTLLFSGLTFIGPKDAMAVVVRYIVSVLVCRVILMYEIAGMRERYIETTRGQALGFRSSPAAKHRSLVRMPSFPLIASERFLVYFY